MIVLLTISAKPYRKALIVIQFFRCILPLFSSSSVSLSDLTATVAAYFAILISSTKREVEFIVDSIHHDFFHVDNLQGGRFFDSSGKPTMVSDLDNRAADIAFITFRRLL